MEQKIPMAAVIQQLHTSAVVISECMTE